LNNEHLVHYRSASQQLISDDEERPWEKRIVCKAERRVENSEGGEFHKLNLLPYPAIKCRLAGVSDLRQLRNLGSAEAVRSAQHVCRLCNNGSGILF
jgi:hypothetical protein